METYFFEEGLSRFFISFKDDHYRPQTNLREGYVFTGVCDSVHRGGCLPGGVVSPGGVSVSVTLLLRFGTKCKSVLYLVY